MADLLKPAFRATSGLDAAGEKVINVAKADYTILDDGVNVEFFIEENTLQQYDATRWYRKDFAIIYDNRVWVAREDVGSETVPAGTFTEVYWRAVRTDPKWFEVKTPLYQLKSGDYITVNSTNGPCQMSTPSNPQDGDTIVIKDIGQKAGYNKINIKATAQNLVRFGAQVQEILISKPNSYNILIFSNRLWNFYEGTQEERGIRLEPSAGEFQSQAGDKIIRRFTSAAPITIVLPLYANQGDIITTVDIDGLSPLYHTIIKTSDPSISVGTIGTTQKEYRTAGDGMFVYNEPDKLWVVYDADLRTRIKPVRGDIKLMPNDSVTVFGDNNMTPQTINITLPTNVAIGDTVKIALNYLRKQQTVLVKASGTDVIATDIKLLQFPKRSEYPPDATWVTVTQLEFNGDINYTPVIEFAYIQDGSASYWIVAQNVPTVERVDSLNDATRKRLGVIALASQTEANVDHENAPVKEQAITPQTLANRVATETRRGIARIATTAQVNQDTTFAFQDDLIISPKKLNERTATETRRGVAEIATQAETNAGTDDSTIITPKKLEARKASESLTGIAKLVSTVGTKKAATRAEMGTNVYNKDNNVDIVTPKSLNQLKGEYEDQGLFYSAIESEVISGQVNVGFENVAVTPIELHKKTATETRIGFSELATQVETNEGTDDFRIVTPKKLNDRKATETLTGISRIGTQVEFDAGTLDTVISTPLKVKTHFNDTARTSVTAVSGLVETGTLWNHYTLDIKEAKEDQRGTLRLSTQAQTDVGADDTTAVTPLKLMRKKATESSEGIIQLATQAELVAGTIDNKAFSPKNYKYVVQQEKSWEATPLRRGYVKLTEDALTWKGDNVNGSVANQSTFEKLGYAVSPYEMNLALSHYLPIGAKAVDADKLDGLDSLQFIRRDVDQTVNGKLTLTLETIAQAPLTSTSTASFQGKVTAGSVLAKGPIQITVGTNNWVVDAPLNAKTLTIGNATSVLTLNSETGNVAVQNNVSSGNNVAAKSAFVLNGSTVITSEAKPVANNLAVGDKAQNLVLDTKDAGNILARDAGDYKVLTEKNAKEIVARDFVKKEGDTMGGKLTVNAPVLPQIPEALALAPLTSANIGFWGSEIKTPAVYETLPGYAVPIMEMKDGVSTGFVDHYEYVKAPGLMTCAGTSIDYIYRTWTPRPITVIENHNANTQWISIWNPAEGAWGEWGRVYTNQAPPTANEIGAVSSSGSAFNNLTIRDWLQIGNVRIEPDQDTRTVKFTWIDIP